MATDCPAPSKRPAVHAGSLSPLPGLADRDLSEGAKHFGYNRVADIASKLGYGRMRTMPKRMMGGSLMYGPDRTQYNWRPMRLY